MRLFQSSSAIVTFLAGLVFIVSNLVEAQNTRATSVKYSILVSKTTYVNKIDFTNSGFVFYYGISGGKIYFYFEGASTTNSLEIVFASALDQAYSIKLDRNAVGPTYCTQSNRYYLNSSPNTLGAVSATSEVCGLGGATTTWNEDVMYSMDLTPATPNTMFTIVPNTPTNIRFIDGAQQYIYTVLFYDSQVCHGVCATCDGPEIDDCTSCNDPTRVSIHNKCVPRLPDVLNTGDTQIWNKFEYATYNTSLYYGFRREQNLDFCYFRIIMSQLAPSTWLGFSFSIDHYKPSAQSYNTDMVVIRYPSGYSASTLPTAYDYSSVSSNTNPVTAGSPPIADTKTNYVVSMGGYDGSTKWDVIFLRLCRMGELTSSGAEPSLIAAYQDTTADYPTMVSCTSAGASCTYSGTATNYDFGFVLGQSATWDSSVLLNNLHSPIIKTPVIPVTNRLLVNKKYCPTCYNTATDCIGPELQDCTKCNPVTEQFDPAYPSTGPGKCIPIIINCQADCATCTTEYNDGCTSCTDSSKFVYPNLVGRCITSKTLFWNQVPLATSDLSFYYGWDSSYEFIYFRFVGGIQAYVGLLFAPALPTGLQTDLFYITYTTGLNVFDGNCSTSMTCFASAETVQDLVVVPGSTYDSVSPYLDVTVARKAKTTDATTYDVDINSAFVGVTLYYKNAGGVLQSISLPTQKFIEGEVCDTTCSTCEGPLSTHCLTCPTGSFLDGSAPAACVTVTSSGCAATCATCKSGSPSYCLTCSSSVQIPYLGACVQKYPQSWNKIYFSLTNFTLYYGFDSTLTNIYFRVTGLNPGWVGFSFLSNALATSKHLNTDMMILRKEDGIVVVEDRYSKTQTIPPMDTQNAGSNNLLYIKGGRDTEGYWDAYFLRPVSTGDTTLGLDFVISPNVQFKLSFAYGPTDVLTYHTAAYTVTTSFKTAQICDSSCLTCIGPEVYQCLTCNTGFILSQTGPATCVLANKTGCNAQCTTCTGSTSSTCISCASSTQTQVLGNCVTNTPTFWNKQILATGLNLYYGFDSTLSKLYFRIKGTGSSGWMGLAFQSSKLTMDMVVIRVLSGTTVVEDRYTAAHNYLPEEDVQLNGKKDYYYVSGGRTGTNTWDVTFMRSVSVADTTKTIPLDSTIDSRIYTLSVAYGATDAFFEQHSSVVSVPNVVFITQQVCDTSCKTCSGPETTDCTSCYSGQQLSGTTAPSTCITPSLTCHANCLTCSGSSSSDCLTCVDSTKIVFEGNCILQVPALWNRIEVNSNFALYYGYDLGGSYIYFRALGTSSGWFGVGFGETMVNTDMHIVRSVSSVATVEDRYSLGHVVPILDLQSNLKVITCGWSGSTNLDCKWVRPTISADTTYDASLVAGTNRTMIFAFGASPTSFTQHTSTLMKTNITLSRSQVCYSSDCVSCTGPLEADCTEKVTTTTVTTTKSTVDWNHAKRLSTALYLFAAALIGVLFG